MLSFTDWLIYENVQIVSVGGESFDFDDEIAGMDHDEVQRQSWDIAKSSPINILRDKDLQAAAIMDGKVVGVLFDSWEKWDDRDAYSFDVIVSPKYQQQGIGKKLIDYAMSTYRWDSEGRDDPLIKAEVVNKNLIPLLARMGFKTWKVEGGITIMIYGQE